MIDKIRINSIKKAKIKQKKRKNLKIETFSF